MNKNQLKTIVAALTYSEPTARNYPEPAKRHTDALKFATDALALVDHAVQPGICEQALAGEIAAAVLADENVEGCDLSAGLFGTEMTKVIRRIVQIYLASAFPQHEPAPSGALAALAEQWRNTANHHELSALEADSIGDMPATVQQHEVKAEALRQTAGELESALSTALPQREPVGEIVERADVNAKTEWLRKPYKVLQGRRQMEAMPVGTKFYAEEKDA